ncbi:hypothetical protein BJV82DRAFT_577411 [Fennellomyces sp. T-0311]|nr:hypothetical protein BJV82DRAFT_577411 [Fennellomyces sp. T-0311]
MAQDRSMERESSGSEKLRHTHVAARSSVCAPNEPPAEFGNDARTVSTTSETVFEDTSAKATAKQHHYERCFAAVTVASFKTTLVEKHGAIGSTPSNHSLLRLVVPFATEEDRDKACAMGVTMANLIAVGTRTIGSRETVYQLNLFELSSLLKKMFAGPIKNSVNCYGKVLDIQLTVNTYVPLSKR